MRASAAVSSTNRRSRRPSSNHPGPLAAAVVACENASSAPDLLTPRPRPPVSERRAFSVKAVVAEPHRRPPSFAPDACARASFSAPTRSLPPLAHSPAVRCPSAYGRDARPADASAPVQLSRALIADAVSQPCPVRPESDRGHSTGSASTLPGRFVHRRRRECSLVMA